MSSLWWCWNIGTSTPRGVHSARPRYGPPVGRSITKALSRHTVVMILHWSSCLLNSLQQTAYLHPSSCEGHYHMEHSHPPIRNQEGQLSCLAHCATQPRETTPPPPVCDQESLATAWISRSPHFLRFSPIALLHERCLPCGVSISCKHILNQCIPLISHQSNLCNLSHPFCLISIISNPS